jgi:hypothetical protein
VSCIAGSHNIATHAEFARCSNSTVPNQPAGVFWAVLNRLLIIAQTVVLILSELGMMLPLTCEKGTISTYQGWPATLFDHYFPVLGSNFGVGALGLMQCL